MLKFVRTALLLILPLSFPSTHAAESERAEVSEFDVPGFCRSHDMIWDSTMVEWRRRECLGVHAINQRDYRAAATHFEAMGSLVFHEAPATGRFAPLALALEKAGDHIKALVAIDTAYMIILVDAGFIKCDENNDFGVVPNEFTDGIEREIVDEVGGRMCGPLFNLSDTVYGKGRILDLSKPHIGADEYEYVRRAIGYGKALPVE